MGRHRARERGETDRCAVKLVLGIDPGRKSGAALVAADGHTVVLKGLWQVRDSPDGRDAVVREALAFGTPAVYIEKFGAGIGAGGFFGARTLAGIERNVGAWEDALIRAGLRVSGRVLPQSWRKAVLGTAGGGSVVLKRLAVDYVNVRFGMEQRKIDLTADVAEAVCIALWGAGQ